MDKEIKFYLPERCQQYETCVYCSNAWSPYGRMCHAVVRALGAEIVIGMKIDFET